MCWLSIYFGISSSLLQLALVDPVLRIRCAALPDPIVGAFSPEITTEKPSSVDAAGLHRHQWWCCFNSGACMTTIVVFLQREQLPAHGLPQRRVSSFHSMTAMHIALNTEEDEEAMMIDRYLREFRTLN